MIGLRLTRWGEEYKRYEVGKNNVKEIQYHTPVGEGDRHYCDIYFDNTDNVKRIFNINEIWGSNLE